MWQRQRQRSIRGIVGFGGCSHGRDEGIGSRTAPRPRRADAIRRITNARNSARELRGRSFRGGGRELPDNDDEGPPSCPQAAAPDMTRILPPLSFDADRMDE